MKRDTRRTICKIANYMTQKGANQSEAWKSAWKMYNEGIFVSLEGTNWTDSQVGLRSNIGAYIAIINCNGKYGNTYRKLQIRSGSNNLGFLPSKIGNMLKYTDTVPFIGVELYIKQVNGQFEAKVKLRIVDRVPKVLSFAV